MHGCRAGAGLDTKRGDSVLPLRRGKGGLEALGNWYSFRVRPIVSPGADAVSLLSALARGLARRTGRITLSGLPDEDGSATLVERAFRRSGWSVFRDACDSNHHLPVAGRTYAEYLAGRSDKLTVSEAVVAAGQMPRLPVGIGRRTEQG